uniref:Uncharacterized protein n=1 Tax=Anguilla anguilla TaxID=7936 RepID=A0A0E9PV53_ANGAN
MGCRADIVERPLKSSIRGETAELLNGSVNLMKTNSCFLEPFTNPTCDFPGNFHLTQCIHTVYFVYTKCEYSMSFHEGGPHRIS